VLACTHYPLLIDQLTRLAPWPVDWIDPAPAIARRVTALLGPATSAMPPLPASITFTSGQRPGPVLARGLEPFFGSTLPAA
jgi:glutamate racemase